MQSGAIDILAFIGGSVAADALIKQHPHPHRLKIFLQLEGKNLGIVTPDANLDEAVEQIVIGSTTFNGQRCTAIKLAFVHSTIIELFLEKLVAKFATLKVGLPWEDNVSITPLPEQNKPRFLQDLMADAVLKGAGVLFGGSQAGALMTPAIVFPVTSQMRLWREEQFGPVLPVAVYQSQEEINQYFSETPFGQQAAVFTSNATAASPLIDLLSTAVGRINVNVQCGRSPDVFPFSGRRSSAMGTMSITESLLIFSTETLVATKASEENEMLVKEFDQKTRFLAPV